MAHIDLPDGAPGILGLMAFRPETAKPLNDLAEVLLRGESSLTRGERELIAAYVSNENDCYFCCASHSSFAAAQLPGGHDVVESVKAKESAEAVSPKLLALLTIAGEVARGGLNVGEHHVQSARDEGATDVEIHDTVLIAAAFCMFNRYVDGLGTWAPTDRTVYDDMAQMIVTEGYAASTPGT